MQMKSERHLRSNPFQSMPWKWVVVYIRKGKKKRTEMKRNHSYDNAKSINCIAFDARCLMLMEIILTFCSFYPLTASHIHFIAHHIQFARFFSPLLVGSWFIFISCSRFLLWIYFVERLAFYANMHTCAFIFHSSTFAIVSFITHVAMRLDDNDSYGKKYIGESKRFDLIHNLKASLVCMFNVQRSANVFFSSNFGERFK